MKLLLIPILALLSILMLFGCTAHWPVLDKNKSTIISFDDRNLIIHKSVDLNMYPNPAFTPGDILTTDAKIVCVSGYSSRIRNVSESLKTQIYAKYGVIDHNADTYEMDHFIPLELGGSNDAKNLWPEAADPRPGFHEKDAVENYLHHRVCDDKDMNLPEAQKEIKTDWYKIYMEMGN